MRIRAILSIALSLAMAACGGGKSEAPTGQPAIRDISLSPGTAVVGSGDINAPGGFISSTLSFHFDDPDANITTVQLSYGGSVQMASISGVMGMTSGTISGKLQLSTAQAGTFPLEVSVTDNLGNRSNTLATTFMVTGPSPTVTSISPATIVTGGADLTLTVHGTHFFPDSKVTWNGSPRPTTCVDEGTLTAAISSLDIAQGGSATVSVENPVIEGGPSYSNARVFLTTLSTLVVGEAAHDLAWDSSHGVLYASVSGPSSKYGDSILVIDPSTGSILRSVFAGSGPDKLAVSDDGQYLYAGLNAESVIKRFRLPDLTLDNTITLGTDAHLGPYFALDLQVAPQHPHTIAASLGCSGVSPSAIGGVVIFDDSIARPTKVPGWGTTEIEYLQWAVDGSTIFASGDYTSYYLLSVDPTGVSLATEFRDIFPSGSGGIHLEPGLGLLYTGSGQVLDPTNGQTVGSFAAKGPMVPFAALNTAFFLTWNSQYSDRFIMSAFDATRYTLNGSVSIPAALDLTGFKLPNRFIRWGSQGLASTGNGHAIYIYSGPFLRSGAVGTGASQTPAVTPRNPIPPEPPSKVLAGDPPPTGWRARKD